MYPKNLGIESARLLTTLAGQGQIVFTVDAAMQAYGKSYSATVQTLRRLDQAGWVVRLSAGKYAIVSLEAGEQAIPNANRLVIGRELVDHASYYISHDSALEIHNMLTRPVTTVTITTSRRLLNRTVLHVPYRFVFAKPENPWGLTSVWVMPEQQVQVSDLERTILDGLARPDLCAGISEVATGLWLRKDDFDWEKLVAYAHRFDNRVAGRRLGYLLEIFDLADESIRNNLQSLAGVNYALLDPMLPGEGHHVARWRLQINLDAEYLKGIVTT